MGHGLEHAERRLVYVYIRSPQFESRWKTFYGGRRRKNLDNGNGFKVTGGREHGGQGKNIVEEALFIL